MKVKDFTTDDLDLLRDYCCTVGLCEDCPFKTENKQFCTKVLYGDFGKRFISCLDREFDREKMKQALEEERKKYEDKRL